MLKRTARLLALTVLLLSAFPAAFSVSAEEGAFTIGLSLPSLDGSFFEGLNNGAFNTAYEEGADLIVVVADNDVETELANVESLIEQEVDVILLRPVDPVLSVPALEAANEAKVPVILLGQLEVETAETGEAAETLAIASLITGNNLEGGKMAAAALCERVTSGVVLELVGLPDTLTYERNAGFEAYMAENCPDVSLVPFETAELEGTDLTDALVETFHGQTFKGVFGYDSVTTLAALEASIIARSRGVTFIGFDATEESIAAIQSGRLRAIITPYGSDLGEIGVKTSLALLEGEDVQETVEVAVAVLDNTTMGAFRSFCRNPRGCD
jgi:ribose transport system substrate-binding protein